ncbi:MAG: HEAT repeat domain-containing protein [Ignavibacteriales bacterium]|nr:HEAT repeat domain-containing protein [Ignavibacteriales bacterium]
MKTTLFHNSEKLYFGLAAILFILLVTDTFGQNQKISDLSKHKYALQNLVIGIHSENEGVRESSIYLAGQYRFIDTENALIEQLKVEKDSDIKVLIGLALFRMNSEKGMNELQMLTKKDSNPRVRRMSQAICNEYLVKYTNRTADVQR